MTQVIESHHNQAGNQQLSIKESTFVHLHNVLEVFISVIILLYVK